MSKYIILGHENPDVDSIVSGYIYQNYLNRCNVDAEFIIPDETIEEDTLEICRNFHLEPTKFQKTLQYDKDTKFILVDHHKRDGIGEIALIFDHHPSINSPDDETCLNEALSSTASLIVQGYEPYYSIHEIELACLATMVDTASFHSTKSRQQDIDWVRRMCEEKSLDYDKLFEAGLSLNNLDNPEEAMLHGLKKHNINGHRIESSTIHINHINKHWKDLTEIVNLLGEYVTENDLDMFVFIAHDMANFEDMVYYIDKNGFKRRKFDEYTSRGTTIIPELEQTLSEKPKQKEKK